MGTVIYPEKFKSAAPPAALTQQRGIQIYTALLNIHQNLHVSIINHQHINQFILQHPTGLDESHTLSAACAISKNNELLEKILDCVGMLMSVLMVEQSGMKMDVTFVPETPDDQPPAA